MKKDHVFCNLPKAIILLHFIIAVILLPCIINAQSESEKGLPFITNYSPKSYKAFPQVWSILEDESGIMYFGSQNDLLEYDGVKWRKTKFMYSFYQDGNYYVHQQGLGLFKMTNDSLVLVPGSEFLGKERMQVMLPYKTTGNEKQYLIGMFYSGLYLYDGKTFRPFATEADDVIKSGAILYKGIQLQNGSYVLSTTGKGMVIIDPQGKLLQKINRDVGLQIESIYTVYQVKKGTLCLTLVNGISRVETASPFTKFGLQAGINTGVLFLRRFEGDIYVGTSNGLLKLDQKTGIFSPVPAIPLNQIFTVLPDGKELLVPGDGLFKIKDNKSYTIKESVSADLTLSALYISKKYPDILIGGGTFGIAIFSRSKGEWVFTGYVPGVSDQIWSFSENPDGSIWARSEE